MAIKFAVLRTHDGHAFDLLRPGSKVRADVGGFIEVLATEQADTIRISVNGIELEGKPAKLPADLPAGTADVTIDQIASDAIVDTKEAEIEVIAAPTPPAPQEPEAE